MNLTPSEENYLLAISRISDGDRVSTNELASETGLSAASVTDMIQKLGDKGLIDYEKYRGVRLLASGKHQLNRINENAALWKEFLEERLHYSESDSEEIVEELRHINSPRLTFHLQQYLHTEPHPVATQVANHGSEVEHESAKNQLQEEVLEHTRIDELMQQRNKAIHQEVHEQVKIVESKANQPTLAHCAIGQKSYILGIQKLPEGSEQLIQFLKLPIGSEIEVLNYFPFDQSFLVRYSNQEQVISKQIAEIILIRKRQ